MKKFLAILSALFLIIASNVNAAEPEIYLKDTKVQQGSEATIDLYISSENAIGSIYVEYSLPEGVTLNSVTSEGASVTPNFAKNNFLLGKGSPYFTTGVAATLNVTVAADAELGDHAMTLTLAQAAQPDLTTYTLTNVENTLTIQKEIPVEPQPSDYALEAIPTHVATGATSMTIPVNFKNEGYVKGIDFTIEYPTGMLTTKSGKTYPLTVTDKSRFDTGTAATLTVKAANGTTVTFTNGDNDLVLPNGSGSLLSIPVTLTSVADGVYTVKLSGISVYVTDDSAEDLKTVTLPDYYFSVFVGTPTETDPIVYGHYTTEGKAAIEAAAGNMKTVDMLEATVDGDNPAVEDALVWGPATSSYTRTASTFSTVCVPFDLTSKDKSDIKYYELTSATDESLKFTETTTVAANTPAVFKGTVAVSGEGYVEANASSIKSVEAKNGLTLTGTYTSYELAKNAGYYLSNGYFYGDGATVAPFRGYFAGSIAGVKTLSVLIEDASGIHDITSELSNEDIYNLQGIRMRNTQKGVNIVGGKKVYIKK